MCPLGVTARESRIPRGSAYLRQLASESGKNRIRAGSEPASRSTPDPSQIHPRSTPDPPQIHPRSRCRSRSECRSRFNTQLIAYFAIRVLLWGNFSILFFLQLSPKIIAIITTLILLLYPFWGVIVLS